MASAAVRSKAVVLLSLIQCFFYFYRVAVGVLVLVFSAVVLCCYGLVIILCMLCDAGLCHWLFCSE